MQGLTELKLGLQESNEGGSLMSHGDGATKYKKMECMKSALTKARKCTTRILDHALNEA